MRRNKGLICLALFAALALMVATVGSTASASAGQAVSAKKKCKKKKVSSAKKKKCKKKKTGTTSPVVRATLTWTPEDTSDFDFDLYVFDANGNKAGNGSDAIPMSVLSPDLRGP